MSTNSFINTALGIKNNGAVQKQVPKPVKKSGKSRRSGNSRKKKNRKQRALGVWRGNLSGIPWLSLPASLRVVSIVDRIYREEDYPPGTNLWRDIVEPIVTNVPRADYHERANNTSGLELLERFLAKHREIDEADKPGQKRLDKEFNWIPEGGGY